MGHLHIEIKPLSVNEAWQGRRFKTPAYKKYCRDLGYLLPALKIPEPPYSIYFRFGFSSPLSDWDNCIKTTQDIIAKKYGFNDKLVKRALVDIVQVKKGKEFFDFSISHHEA